MTAPAVSAEWSLELRDIRTLMHLAGVPRGFVLSFVVLWAVGMLLGVGWRYDPAGRSIALTLVIASTVILL